MEICISLGLGPVQPLPSIIIKHNSISIGISLGLVLGLSVNTPLEWTHLKGPFTLTIVKAKWTFSL